MAKRGNDILNELITKHLVGETSPEEQKELSSWINESPENLRHYNELKKTFDLAESHFSPTDFADLNIDVEQEWDYFKEKVGEKKSRHLAPVQLWLRIAATILLLVATGGIVYYYTASTTTVYQTAANKETVILPDGSTVTLNRDTRLSYDRTFGDDSRTVRLHGEAFFEVGADADKPFIILTGETLVRVVGTSFNVNAYDSMDVVEVVVQTGVVSFQETASEAKVQLVAGDKGIYSKAKDALATVVNDDVNFLSWNTKRMVFVRDDLRTVIETLEKTYQVHVKVSTEIPEACIVTVTFENQSLESVLKVLENTLNLKYTINGNDIEITEAGC